MSQEVFIKSGGPSIIPSLHSALPTGVISVGVPALSVHEAAPPYSWGPRDLRDDVRCPRGFWEKRLFGGSIIMTIRLSTELNLSLGPSVRSFLVERFWALYTPLCLDGGKDNHGRWSLTFSG
ncbi:unnamed protein product [Pipistrellus nathusii]|uniref:Uncharacterized protein n=1 Tax=Pipistrellus nathusii TaxID=59473 RepID=A0ABN9ZVY9_PIPNA